MTKTDKILKAVGLFAITVAVAPLRWYLLKLIWNASLTKAIGAPPITWWQAFAISFFIASVTLDGKTEDKPSAVDILGREATQVIGLLVGLGLAHLFF